MLNIEGYHDREYKKWATIKRIGPHWDYMAVFSAFLDDSGTHDGSPLAVVGGVILSEKGMDDFQKAWHKTLADHGVRIFHSADCDAGYGEFGGWPKERRRSLSLELSRIVSRHASDIMAYGTSPTDFSSVWKGLRLSDIGVRNDVYRMLLELCFHRLGDWAQRLPPNDTLKISVELGNKKASFINDLYIRGSQDPNGRRLMNITEISFDPKELPPLQAADLLVHKVYKYHPHLGTDTMEPALQELIDNHDMRTIRLWRREELEEVMRERLTHDKHFRKRKQQ